MGFMDSFTPDCPVTVKQPDYYEMIKQTAKAELIENAVKADVPGYYIQAMVTGEKPEFLNTLVTEESEKGFRTEYEQITGAAVAIFEAWEETNGVENAATGIIRIINVLCQNRIGELKTIKENREKAEAWIRGLQCVKPWSSEDIRKAVQESEGTDDEHGSSTGAEPI